MRLAISLRAPILLIFLVGFSESASASGYFWWFGSIYYSGPYPFTYTEVKLADVPTFKPLRYTNKETVFAKDKYRVYCFETEVEGADTSTFETLGGAFGKDRESVFYFGRKVPGADPRSFEVLSNYYGKDREHAFRGEKMFVVKDIDSFRFDLEIYTNRRHSFIENNELFTRDNLDYYYFDGRDPIAMNVVHLETFQLVELGKEYSDFGLWTSDGSNYYCRGRRVPVHDPSTFKILNSFFSRDDISVYYIDKVVVGADASTFTVDLRNYQVGKDKFRTYWGSSERRQ